VQCIERKYVQLKGFQQYFNLLNSADPTSNHISHFQLIFTMHVLSLKYAEQASAGFGWGPRYLSVIEVCW